MVRAAHPTELNPLEHLQTAKAEYYRYVIVDGFGPELLVR